MFAWLKNWSKESTVRTDLYQPAERRIYAYFNGDRLIHADPILLYKRLMNKSTEIDVDRKVASSQSKDALKAHDSLVSHIREVFGVKTLADGGLLDDEVVELLDHFLAYLDQSKKNLPTSTTSLNSSAASDSFSAESRPIPNSSGCGSTANGPTTEQPTPSGSASSLPRGRSTQATTSTAAPRTGTAKPS